MMLLSSQGHGLFPRQTLRHSFQKEKGRVMGNNQNVLVFILFLKIIDKVSHSFLYINIIFTTLWSNREPICICKMIYKFTEISSIPDPGIHFMYLCFSYDITFIQAYFPCDNLRRLSGAWKRRCGNKINLFIFKPFTSFQSLLAAERCQMMIVGF